MELIIYFILATFNTVLCFFALIESIRKKHLISIFYMFSTYISIMFFFTGFSGKYQILGFIGKVWTIEYSDMRNAMLFVFFSNALFYLGTKLPNIKIKTISEKNNKISATKIITNSYFIVFIISFFVYFFKMYNQGYQGFVEYSGSDWSRVFLIVSSVVVILSFVRKNYLVLILCITFMSILSYLIDVRSFFVLTIIPLVVYIWINQNESILNKKNIWLIFSFITFLALISSAISYSKIGKIVVPESGLSDYYILIHDRITYGEPKTGFNSLLGFLEGVMTPFLKLAGVSIFNAKEDTPIYMASLIFGTIDFKGSIFHYPSLWYSDSFVSFGSFGCLLGLFWGWLITCLDRVMRSNKNILLFFMPYFVWFVIFVFRGAIANSTIAISYPFYIQLLIFIFFTMTQTIFYRYKTL